MQYSRKHNSAPYIYLYSSYRLLKGGGARSIPPAPGSRSYAKVSKVAKTVQIFNSTDPRQGASLTSLIT